MPSRRNVRLRAAIAISLLWAALLSGIAGYERATVDPWRFIGENRGPVFYTWSSRLIYDKSPFGEIELVFRARRYWALLLLPIAAVLTVAAILPASPGTGPSRCR